MGARTGQEYLERLDATAPRHGGRRDGAQEHHVPRRVPQRHPLLRPPLRYAARARLPGHAHLALAHLRRPGRDLVHGAARARGSGPPPHDDEHLGAVQPRHDGADRRLPEQRADGALPSPDLVRPGRSGYATACRTWTTAAPSSSRSPPQAGQQPTASARRAPAACRPPWRTGPRRSCTSSLPCCTASSMTSSPTPPPKNPGSQRPDREQPRSQACTRRPGARPGPRLLPTGSATGGRRPGSIDVALTHGHEEAAEDARGVICLAGCG